MKKIELRRLEKIPYKSCMRDKSSVVIIKTVCLGL